MSHIDEVTRNDIYNESNILSLSSDEHVLTNKYMLFPLLMLALAYQPLALSFGSVEGHRPHLDGKLHFG